MYLNSNISTVQSIPDHKINDMQSLSNKRNEENIKKSKFDQDAFKLDEAEKKTIQKLKERDREVRTHEQQHKAVAGQYATGMSFSYQTGPDGHQYAVGGQVQLDTSAIPNDPKATIEKMKQIKRAAMAPSQPSSKDHQVASESEQEIVRQQAKLQKENNKKANEGYQMTDAKETNMINIYS